MTSPDTAPQRPSPRRWLAIFLRLVGSLLGFLVLALLALWIWAGTNASLPTTLGWAQKWLNQQPAEAGMGRLTAENVRGSLLGGGSIASLHWSSEGLDVRAEDVSLRWNRSVWWDALTGKGLHLAELKTDSLLVHDERSPSGESTDPIQSLTLPMPVGVAFDLKRVSITGKQSLVLDDIRGRYAYGMPTDMPGTAFTHRLQLDSLGFAQGIYKGKATLGGDAPMPIDAELQAKFTTEVPDGAPVAVSVSATASGTLAGEDATIKAKLQGEGSARSPGAAASQFSASALVKPWARRPLIEGEAQFKAVDLSAFRPDVPATDLYGQLIAKSASDGWHLSVQLENRRAGPLDQNALPIQSLEAEVMQTELGWTLQTFDARAAGGSIRGQGKVHVGEAGSSGTTTVQTWQGEVRLDQIKPSHIWSPLAKGALNGELEAKAAPTDDAPDTIALKASIMPAARQPDGNELGGFGLKQAQLDAQWTPHAGSLKVNKAQLDAAGAQVEAVGTVQVNSAQYEGQAKLTMPGSSLRMDGLLAHDRGQGQAAWQVSDARKWLAWVRRLQQLPLVGESVAATLSGQEQLDLDGQISSQWTWQGGWGALGYPAPANSASSPELPKLDGNVSIARLMFRNADPTAAGPIALESFRLQAKGPLNALRLQLKGAASNPEWRAQLTTNGSMALAKDGFTEGRLEISAFSLDMVRLAAESGANRSSHQWQLGNVQPLSIAWRPNARGGSTLDAGAGELKLQPIGPTSQRVDNPLVLSWQSLFWSGQALETQGKLQGLSMPWIEAFTSIHPPADQAQPSESGSVSGDLVFDGEWSARIPADTQQPLSLSASLQRRSGDLRWTGGNGGGGNQSAAASNTAVVAGVKDGRLMLTVRDRQVSAQLSWETERLGQARASFATRLNPAEASLGKDAGLLDRWWPANTPIEGSASAQLPQIGVWSMLAPPGWRVRGALSANATLGGTRGQPNWRGNIEAEDLMLRSVVDGFAFTNGQLQADIVDDRIDVKRFSLQGPGGAREGGTLEASGQAEWRDVPGTQDRQAFIALQAKARQLRVSTRVDRRLVISGDVSAQLEGAILKLRGQLKADTATFVLPDENAPSLSKDVVVRITGSEPEDAAGVQAVKPDVDLTLDLGNDFEVRGKGIETRLEGAVTVRATPSAPTPRAYGEVRTVSGTYRAYGQQLNIETGVLRFTGPYDDPALDIIAVRKLPDNTDQRVGVQITGNAQSPRVDLFAEPDLSMSDKLAWLVLGRPASASGAQAFVLQQAARTLLTRGDKPLDNELAKTLGVDEIGFAATDPNSDGTDSGAALTLGKRLSDRLYLSYEQSLAGAMSTVSILYDLSRSLTLRARAGTENAVDVIFTHQYD